MRRRYKVVAEIGNKTIVRKLYANSMTEAMQEVKDSITFKACFPIEPELNLTERINQLLRMT